MGSDGFVGCVAVFVVRLSLEDPLRLADSAPPPPHSPSATGEGMRAVAFVLVDSSAYDGRDPRLAPEALLESVFESIDWLLMVVWIAIILVPLFLLL